MGPAQIQNLWGAAHRAVRSIFVRLRPDALARALEQVVYVATEIATKTLCDEPGKKQIKNPWNLEKCQQISAI